MSKDARRKEEKTTIKRINGEATLKQDEAGNRQKREEFINEKSKWVKRMTTENGRSWKGFAEKRNQEKSFDEALR